MTKATAKALSRARAALAALEKNAAKSADADATRHRADLITANLHLIEEGEASVEVDCWLTGQKVVIDLTAEVSSSSSSSSSSPSPTSGPSSPSRPALLDPADLAALLYRKARKQRRAEEGTAPRRAQAEETIALLEGVEARLAEISALSSTEYSSFSSSSSSLSSSPSGAAAAAAEAERTLPAPSADLLLSIRDELVAWGHMRPPKDAAAATKAASRARRAERRSGGCGKEESGQASWSSLPPPPPPSSSPPQQRSSGRNSARPFRRFVSPGGLEVLLGRNNRENDELSLRVAGPDDLWLHARGVPGSHAVLRVPSSFSSSSSETLPAEDLEFAASLAAFFSKAREGGKVPVTFTRARNVKKPRGAPPGLVTLMSEKVVSVRPDSVASVVAAATASGAGAEASGSESEGEVA